MLKISQTQLQIILLWFIGLCNIWAQAPSVNADFQVSPTGALTYNIPIAVPSHTLGIFPNLALTYNSQSGDGIAGYGWNLAGLSSITRVGATPYYDNLNDPVDLDLLDRFSIDGQRLILENGSYGASGSTYRTENYSNVKIQAYGTSSFGSWYGPSYFIVTQPDGTRYYYGAYFNSRSKLEWSLCRILDTQGNKVDFSYTLVNETLRLNNITDSVANISVAFTYKTKDNALPIGIGGTLFRNDRLLTNIDVNIGTTNYNSYELEHSETSAHFSRLNSVKQISCENGTIPAITFNYQGADNQYGEYSGNFGFQIGHSEASVVKSGDLNGDEIADYLFYNKDRDDADYKGIYVKLGSKTGAFTTFDSLYTTTEFEEAFFVKYLDTSERLQKNDGIVVVTRLGESNKFFFNLYVPGAAPYSMSLKKQIEWLAPVVKSTGEIVASTAYVASAEIPEITYKVADFNGDGVSDIVPITEGGTYTKRVCYEDCSGGPGPLPYPLIAGPTTNPIQTLAGPTTNFIFPDCETVCDTSEFYNSSQFYFISLEPSYNAETNINEYIGQGAIDDVNHNIMDINADGYLDIYFQQNNIIYADTYDPITKKFRVASTIVLQTDKPVYPGDYNGDGKTDFAQPKADDSYTWYFYINDGNGFESQEKNISIQYREDRVVNHLYDQIDDSTPYNHLSLFRFMYIPVDYNKDGKTDIIRHSVATPYDEQYSDTFSKQWIQFYKNDSEYVSDTNFVNFALEESRTKSNEGKPWSGHPINADLNHLNLSNQYAYAENSGLITIHSYEGDHKAEVTLNKVTNNGLTTNINYASLGDESVKLAAASMDYNATFPYNTIGSAKDLKLVANVNQTAWGGINRTKYYRYGNLVSEAKGVGFLGFGSMANTNWTGNNIATLWNVATYDIYKRHATMAAMVTKNSMKTTGAIDAEFNKTGVLSKTFYEYNYTQHTDKSYTLLVNKTAHTDVLTGVETETEFAYDQYNNILTETQTNDDGGTTSSLTYYNNPSGTNQNYYIGRPKAKTVTKRLGTESFTTYENYTYTNNLLKTLKTKANTSSTLTETYTHDSFGNVLSTTLSGSDFTSRKTSKTYDSTGRFVKTATDIQGFTTKYDYDIYGRLVKETDPFNKSQSFAYDDYHRLTKETDYLGNTITTTYGPSGVGNAYVTKNSSLSGLSDSYEAINRLGWKYYEWTRNDLGQTVKINRDYLSNGALEQESTPYISSSTKLWTTYNYDEYNRPFLINNYNGQRVTTTYNGLTVSVNDGTKTVSSTQDAMGNKISVTDPGGTINYKYYANNTPKETTYGTHKITTKIDAWGRKSELNDPAAGVYTYLYNSLGDILLEKSPLGATSYIYDNFGKVKTKNLSGFQTALYSTFNYNSNGQLSEMNTQDFINNVAYSYEHSYDSYERPSAIVETTPLARFEKKISYDTQGRPNVETTTSKLNSSTQTTTINLKSNYHASSGALIGITDTATNKTLWEAKAQDAFGNYNSMSLGNGITKTNTYNNYGLPTRFVHKSNSVTALDYSLSINEQTGNVSSRHHTFFTGEENFQYDSLDRLKTITGAITETQTYNTDGNIKVNPQVGTYNYDPTTKYRIAGIDLNTSGQNYYQSHTPQDITYNAFKKPVSITEEGNGRVDFEYGPMKNRSVAYYGGESTNKEDRDYTKVYSAIAPVEIIKNNNTGSVKTISYVMGDAYSAPVAHVNDNGNKQFTYLHRDHIGSILAISDSSGAVIEKTHFGAWGTVKKYWDTKGNTDLGYESLLGRGYTGHEHFTSVSLLHMNGRMYDPQLRRFLSPDNFIQDPFNTQSFNRYGYVWNNPLKYNDPSGEIIAETITLVMVIKALVVGASIGVVANGIVNSFNGQGFFEGAGKAALFGAISGVLTMGIGHITTGIPGAFAKGLAQASLHGISQATLAAVQGATPNQAMAAFASGFVASGIASVAGGLTQGLSEAWQTTATIASGALGGGLAAEFSGGSFIEGFRNGAIIATLNHLAHRATEGTDPKAARKKAAAQARQKRLNRMHAKLKSAVTKFGSGTPQKAGIADAIINAEGVAIGGVEQVRNSSAGDWLRGGKPANAMASKVLSGAGKVLGAYSIYQNGKASYDAFSNGDYYSGSLYALKSLAYTGITFAKLTPLGFAVGTAFTVLDTTGHVDAWIGVTNY